ncbi:MAG: hypothetical protein BGO98_21650 [Myxococcales bacterium 68-20]|nr:hypothetical protein [Myxococcales bacterium]OJY28153.1 MAG: hypothetical protein BGO98_21650 [Myxococcales bacterium 68-20]
MTHAKRALWTISAGFLIAAAAACSSLDATGLDDGTERTPGGSKSDGGFANEPSGEATGGAPTATGVIVVHSATFPSFRLCFENHPNLLPQPDSKVMPEANVVGVEVGSLVRLDPLEAPGKIYVVNERAVRSAAGDPTGLTCGELLGDGTQALLPDNDYHVATLVGRPLGLTEPLGRDRVQVLAITGCGSKAFINRFNVDEASCGPTWNTTSGNLVANIINLPTSPAGATKSSIPVQLVHLAPMLEAEVGTANLEVTFGDLAASGPLPTVVATNTALLASSEQVTLNVDQNDESIYGTHGFRIEAREGNGAPKFSFSQSLAAVQSRSSPRDVPTTYYTTASNYALLLLGDPSVPATVDGGAPNPDRRRVQLLAVPVLDPTTVDAGVDSGAVNTEDGG